MGWRDDMIDALIDYAPSQGIPRYDRDKVLALMQSLAIEDRTKQTWDRIGFAYCVDNYSERGLKSILTTIEDRWHSPNGKAQEIAENSPHKYVCVISVKLYNGGSVSQEKLLLQMHSYIFAETEFGASITRVVHLHNDWWDLFVEYSNDLEVTYQSIKRHATVLKAKTKPKAQFGQRIG